MNPGIRRKKSKEDESRAEMGSGSEGPRDSLSLNPIDPKAKR